MKWAGKLLLALLAMGVFLYLFEVGFREGRIVVERRGPGHQQDIERAVNDVRERSGGLGERLRGGAGTGNAKDQATPAQATGTPAHDQPSDRDREQLADLLDEEFAE